MLAVQNKPTRPEEDIQETPHPWDIPTAIVLGVVHLGALGAPFFFSPSAVVLAIVLYALTCLGITLGYHRLLTHRSYRCPRWMELTLATLGSLACQGGPSTWVAVHRLHHSRSDRPGDPHGAHKGFWHAHMGWMLLQPPHKIDPGLRGRYAPDVERDRTLRFLDRGHFFLALLATLAIYKLGGASWLFWGVFVRLTATYHATWLVNSAAHMFGYRSYATADKSTNCWWVALLTFGEGWHNNHHAFPSSARHGLRWYEIDLSWLLLGVFRRAGWVWETKLPRKSRGTAVGTETLLHGEPTPG